jgi:Uma2 family endonuclease
MSPTARHEWTYAEYARFPDDGKRYEVLDGEVLVTPGAGPRHQHVVLTLASALRSYVQREGLGVVLPDVDLLFEPTDFLRPDLLFVPDASRAGISDRGVECTPVLVVEVQSPTSGKIDRIKKPDRYGDFGVPEYWVVDPAERVVWVWRFETGAVAPERVDDTLVWNPLGASEPFTIDMDELFRPM